MAKWEVRNCFDVWGNEKDGWEVNDSTSCGCFDIPETIINNDGKLLQFMVASGWLATSDRRRIEVDGECDIIEIRERKSKRPLYWLTLIDTEYMQIYARNNKKGE